MPLTVSIIEKSSGLFVIAPAGSVDASSYAILEKEVDSLLAKPVKAIIFDMTDVSYISSAGVRVILKTKKGLAPHGGTVMLVNLQPKVKKVFDIIHALPPQQVFASIEELDNYLDHIQKQL